MTEIALALRSVRVCPLCEDLHMRPYPEQPESQCVREGCECWCKLGFLPIDR